MAANFYVQQGKEVRRGLQAARRAYRRADSLGEVLERTLRRLWQRKTPPRSRAEVDRLVNQYYAYRDQVRDLEQVLARDFVAYLE
jgi:hypothetical protein